MLILKYKGWNKGGISMERAREAVSTIDIGRLVWPYWWIKWTNAILVSMLVLTPTTIISSLLKGDLETVASVSIFMVLMAFPGWIAWKNVDVIHSVGQKYTIRTLSLAGVMLILLGGLSLLGGIQASQAREQVSSLAYGFCFATLGLMSVIAALAVALLRRQTIGTIGVPLKTLISNLDGQADNTVPPQTQARHPARGLILIALAVVICVVADFVPMESMSVSSEARVNSNIGQLAFFLILLARGYFQPTAKNLLAADHRQPVLLLRSFIDDEQVNWQHVNASMFDTSFESRLVGHFSRFGPFIAVGTPQEGLPVVGAAREQLRDDEWQAQVIAWIRESRFVLMLAGVTEWVDWELQQVITNGAVGKLMVCFPPVGKRRWKDKGMRKFKVNMQARLDRLRLGFAGTPWEAALNQLDDPRNLRSISFGSDGQITVVRARSRDRNAYHLGVLVAQWVTLRNLLAASNATFRAPPLTENSVDAALSKPALWTASAVLAVAAIGLLWLGMASEWGAVYVPIGLSVLVLAFLANPMVRSRMATRAHRAVATWAGAGVALVLAVHAGLVFGLTAFGELTARHTGDGDGLAFNAMRYPAHAGLPEAQYNLGVFYLNGQGVVKDEAQSCQWMQRAARSGYAPADRLYAVCLLEGTVQPGPGEGGLAILQRASDHGDLDATASLGDAYFFGKGVDKDVLRAIPYYEVVASKGNAIASRTLGLIYLNGEGVPVQYERARAAFEMADEQGDADGAYYLGFMAFQGYGLPRDPRVAGQHFERAVARGSHGAEMMLGAMLIDGDGMQRDVGRARELLLAARASDNPKIKAMVEEVLQGLEK